MFFYFVILGPDQAASSLVWFWSLIYFSIRFVLFCFVLFCFACCIF